MLPILLHKTVSCLLPSKIWRNVFSLEKRSYHFDAPWSVECHWEHLQYLGRPKCGWEKSDGKPSAVGCKTQSKGQKYKKGTVSWSWQKKCGIAIFHKCTPLVQTPPQTDTNEAKTWAWPPGFFDASDSHGDRYNNHCPMAWKLAIGFTFNLRNW